MAHVVSLLQPTGENRIEYPTYLLQFGPSLATAIIWGVGQCMGEFSVFVSASVFLPLKNF